MIAEMTAEMRLDQVFRVKGLAGRAENLEIKISASYGDGRPPAERTADLSGKKCEIDGLSVIIGNDELDIGRSFRSEVTGFSVSISDRVYSVGQLSLKYAICSSADLMNKDYFPEYDRLLCGLITFTQDSGRITVSMRDGEDHAAAPRGENEYSLEDIIGNIKADIAMISRYPNSGGREELEAALRDLLSEAESGADVSLLDVRVRERERQLLGYINSSSGYFKGSGKHLLEKTGVK